MIQTTEKSVDKSKKNLTQKGTTNSTAGSVYLDAVASGCRKKARSNGSIVAAWYVAFGS